MPEEEDEPPEEARRRRLWIEYYVNNGMYEDAVETGWDLQNPPDPRSVEIAQQMVRLFWCSASLCAALPRV